MKKCSFCGADLPENARFCGKCGNVQKAVAPGAAASGSNIPQPQSGAPEDGTLLATWSPYSNYPTQGSGPAWSPNAQGPVTPPPVAENVDERRRGIPPWSPLYGAALGGEALLGSGQISSPGAPFVQGTPQIGNVPGVAGTPNPYANAPVSPPAQGPAHAPFHPPMQGPGNAAPVNHPVQGPPHMPVSHPIQGPGHAPVSHPVQGPVHMPVSHPIQRPQPIHQPPQQPGTQEHPPIHNHHRHHDHPDQREPQHHPTHHTQQVHHTVAHVTKVAGGSSIKTIIIVVTVVAVAAAGGIAAAAHFLARPQPYISITSNYKVGNAPAGATGTILQISGQQFASNAAITFLLDGQVAPGNPGTRSDASGNFNTNLTITSAWSVGTHTLTARDASNNSTQHSVSVTIVQQGQANTPGPDGAPPDDASFRVIAQIQGSQTTETEVITGHPDPMGGTVCQSEDTGQPIASNGVTFNTQIPYRATSTYSCAGSYKGGKLTLTETLTSQTSVFTETDGSTATCTLKSPQIDEQLSGSYTGNNTFSGTLTYPAIPQTDFSCVSSNGFYAFNRYEQANWTGQVTDLHV